MDEPMVGSFLQYGS